jgi:hypothetical protein
MNSDILRNLLGGAKIAGGALVGSPALMRAGVGQVGPQGHAIPPSVPGGMPNPSVYGIPDPPLAVPIAPPTSPRPALPYSSGGGSPMPTQPAFRFPSGRLGSDEMTMQ